MAFLLSTLAVTPFVPRAAPMPYEIKHRVPSLHSGARTSAACSLLPGGARTSAACSLLPGGARASATSSLLHGGARTSAACSLRSVLPARGLGLESVRRRSRRLMGTVCYASPLGPHTLQWISAVSAAILMFAKGTAIQKSYLVPLVALQAPSSVVSWIKGEYGLWTAFLALLLRLFYFIPGELDLPFLTMLLVIVAPYQTLDLRGTQSGAILSLVIAGYLAYQHFSRAGSLRKAFDIGSILATLAIVCITVVPIFFLV